MPEYLAPGVYVEETSFRAKSIEGVGTSTSGFVGPTLTGPVGGTPELLTSFGDFERIYGGLDDLGFGSNYLAHAVRAYFNEGGARLYVSRAFLGFSKTELGLATSDYIVNNGAAAADRVRFVARFPGTAGSGFVTVREVASPASAQILLNAPEGSVIRQTPTSLRQAAQLRGGVPPFALPDGSKLAFKVNDTAGEITFSGQAASITGSAALADNITPSGPLMTTINGIPTTITLPTTATPRADAVTAIRAALDKLGATVSLTNDNKLVIATKRKGSHASITVKQNPAFGFAADASAGGTEDANNNIPDLSAVTVDDVNKLLAAGAINARLALAPADGRVLISTTTTDNTSPKLEIIAPPEPNAVSANGALGLPKSAANGQTGSPLAYYEKVGNTWLGADGNPLDVTNPALENTLELITLTVITEDQFAKQMVFDELGLSPAHPSYIGTVLTSTPSRRSDALENMVALEWGSHVTPLAFHDALFSMPQIISQDGVVSITNERVIALRGGNDGVFPTQKAHEDALLELAKLEDIAIVAAPGYSVNPDAQGIQGALIAHAEGRKAYRIAVLDTPPNFLVSEARIWRSKIDSTHAALYYPWVIVSNPLARPGDAKTPREIALPPSGFVCGVYARTDIERAVYKAPANEVVRAALRFERDVNFAEQEVLNPLGVNCLRFLTGRGYRVWGARTISSDPEWKYVNIRRYFNYLEASIDRGTQWAVFEPNGELLWANVRETISSFLYNEWVSGALLGSDPKESFFVRCDRSTMTQNDLDNGRLICLIGVAALKPAEFVILRIGQKTVDARS